MHHYPSSSWGPSAIERLSHHSLLLFTGATPLGPPSKKTFPPSGRVKTANAPSIRRWPRFLREPCTFDDCCLLASSFLEWPQRRNCDFRWPSKFPAAPINKEDGRVAMSSANSSSFLTIIAWKIDVCLLKSLKEMGACWWWCCLPRGGGDKRGSIIRPIECEMSSPNNCQAVHFSALMVAFPMKRRSSLMPCESWTLLFYHCISEVKSQKAGISILV